MKSSKMFHQWLLALLILTVLHLCKAKGLNFITALPNPLLTKWIQGNNTIIVEILSFVVALVCSASGVGGGPLFLPILNLIGGIDLKLASTYSSFMVTGVLLSNVLYYLFFSHSTDGFGRPSLIDFNLTLLSEPFLLLGVSVGVICNSVFPEWLIIVLFIVFLGFSTYRTWRTGVRLRRSETEGFLSRSVRIERGRVLVGDRRNGSLFDSLLGEKIGPAANRIPAVKMVVLISLWACFFLLQLLKEEEDLTHIKPCGVAYLLITFSQIPLALLFTAYVLKKTPVENHQNVAQDYIMRAFTFPSVGLITGILNGLFGIAGGLLLNPLLLRNGLPPQTAAVTTTFMLFFSASMSTVQYAIMGTPGIEQASVFGLICFTGSAIGLIVVQKAIDKSGRASLIVFAITGVMAVSLAAISFGGAVDVWREYANGDYMGFKTPCSQY